MSGVAFKLSGGAHGARHFGEISRPFCVVDDFFKVLLCQVLVARNDVRL